MCSSRVKTTLLKILSHWPLRAHEFDKLPVHYHVTTLGKQYNLLPANGLQCSVAGEVTAGLEESNDSSIWLITASNHIAPHRTASDLNWPRGPRNCPPRGSVRVRTPPRGSDRVRSTGLRRFSWVVRSQGVWLCVLCDQNADIFDVRVNLYGSYAVMLGSCRCSIQIRCNQMRSGGNN